MSELSKELKMMHPNKLVHGPGDFNLLFFQLYWDVVSHDVSQVVLIFLTEREFRASFNHTNVFIERLIP